MNRLITIKTSSYILDLRVDYSNKEGKAMAESIITNALNSEHIPEIHIVPVIEEAAKIVVENVKEEIMTTVTPHEIGVALKTAFVEAKIPYDNSKETQALRIAAKTMGIKRLKWIVREINGVKVRTIDRRTFNGKGRNRLNTTISKILQS
jgi:hypothetical protein